MLLFQILRATWSVVSSVFVSFGKQVVYKVSAVQDTGSSEVEPAEEPAVEIEIGGQIFSYHNWSEVLWLHRVNRRRTRGTGLALLFAKISEFSLQVALWVSWVLFSLGELTKHLC